MPVSAQTYERVALEDPEGRWELWCGRLREKPAVTTEHAEVIATLTWILDHALDRRDYSIRPGYGRLRIENGSFFAPDLCVIPKAQTQYLLERPGTFEVYSDPVPLLVEVWSPSTGGYDVTAKLSEYQRRGDLEIWYIQPYDLTLTAWRRQPNGSYSETVFREGTITASALPGVSFDLASLFDFV